MVGMAERLSVLDAAFLAVEGPSRPMHVGWVAVFDPPAESRSPGFDELFEHIAGRLGLAPHFRQRLAGVPLGLHDPVWVDDAEFDVSEHLLPAAGRDLDALVDGVLSSPLPRDRPLWQIAIADDLPGGRIALIGKMHHCMVDGTAVVELGNLLLDADPEAWREPTAPPGTRPAPVPSPVSRLGRALAERAGDGAALVLAPVRVATSPRRLRGLPGAASAGARTLAHAVLPPAPRSELNRPGSAGRRLVRHTRSLDDIRAIRRRFRVTPNDVVLAACAGALRRCWLRRGEPPQPLKAMVPSDVRSVQDVPGRGNRISFVFVGLPCGEPDPVERLRAVGRATEQRQRDREAEQLDVAFPGPGAGAAADPAGARPRVRPSAAVQPHDLERGRTGRAALPARLPPSRGAFRGPARRPPRAVDRRRDRRPQSVLRHHGRPGDRARRRGARRRPRRRDRRAARRGALGVALQAPRASAGNGQHRVGARVAAAAGKRRTGPVSAALCSVDGDIRRQRRTARLAARACSVDVIAGSRGESPALTAISAVNAGSAARKPRRPALTGPTGPSPRCRRSSAGSAGPPTERAALARRRMPREQGISPMVRAPAPDLPSQPWQSRATWPSGATRTTSPLGPSRSPRQLRRRDARDGDSRRGLRPLLRRRAASPRRGVPASRWPPSKSSSC